MFKFRTSIMVIFLILTSIFWIPLLILFSPMIIFVFLLCKYTKVGEFAKTWYSNIYASLFYKSGKTRKYMWQQFYDFISWLYPQVQWKFMNYGYAVLNENGKLINNLQVEYEDERFPLQLYYYLSTGLGLMKNLNGMNVLEVGCGRGGGLNYISKYLGPEKCIGIDISSNQIDFCRKAYNDNPKVFFYLGDSENLTKIPAIKTETFNIIINLESSHCYSDVRKFVSGVEQLLKPDGLFLIADYIESSQITCWEEDLKSSGLVELFISYQENITINVLHALKLDEKRKLDLINTSVHSWLRPLFKKFSGFHCDHMNQSLQKKETHYKAYVLKKTSS